MNAAEVLEALSEHGAVQDGHFRLSSGLHSDRYVQCALVLQWPGIAERLGHELGSRFAGSGVEVVVGPAMGGVLIAHEVARYLGVRMIFPERVEAAMELRRGFEVRQGERAVVVEDVVTTGRSPREAIALLHDQGAEVVGVGAIVNRSGGTVSFGVRFEELVRIDANRWPSDECPLCRSGVELRAPGSRYLNR